MNPELYLATKKAWRARKQAEMPLVAPGATYSAFTYGAFILGLITVCFVGGCQQMAQANLKETVISQLKGSEATVSEITVKSFSEEQVNRIAKARKELGGQS